MLSIGLTPNREVRTPMPDASAAEPTTPEQSAATDALILTSASNEYCKVAVLIAKTTDAARAQALEVGPQAIAARIYALTDSGQLTVQGNVRRWRAAEVRLGKPS
jgi:hypothetical protein